MSRRWGDGKTARVSYPVSRQEPASCSRVCHQAAVSPLRGELVWTASLLGG